MKKKKSEHFGGKFCEVHFKGEFIHTIATCHVNYRTIRPSYMYCIYICIYIYICLCVYVGKHRLHITHEKKPDFVIFFKWPISVSQFKETSQPPLTHCMRFDRKPETQTNRVVLTASTDTERQLGWHQLGSSAGRSLGSGTNFHRTHPPKHLAHLV